MAPSCPARGDEHPPAADHCAPGLDTINVVRPRCAAVLHASCVPHGVPSAAGSRALPTELRRLEFSVLYRGQLLELAIDDETVTVTSRTSKAQPVSVGLAGTPATVEAGGRLELSFGSRPVP